jgi:hypothetical protein
VEILVLNPKTKCLGILNITWLKVRLEKTRGNNTGRMGMVLLYLSQEILKNLPAEVGVD